MEAAGRCRAFREGGCFGAFGAPSSGRRRRPGRPWLPDGGSPVGPRDAAPASAGGGAACVPSRVPPALGSGRRPAVPPLAWAPALGSLPAAAGKGVLQGRVGAGAGAGFCGPSQARVRTGALALPRRGRWCAVPCSAVPCPPPGVAGAGFRTSARRALAACG